MPLLFLQIFQLVNLSLIEVSLITQAECIMLQKNWLLPLLPYHYHQSAEAVRSTDYGPRPAPLNSTHTTVTTSKSKSLWNARVIDLMTLNSDSDFKAKSDDSDSSHDSKSLESGLGYIRVKIGHISPQSWSF